MGRIRRQLIISELLSGGLIPSQERLRVLLAERGIEATQATLSRDLREMGVAKGPAGYVLLGQSYEPAPKADVARDGSVLSESLDRVMGEYVISAVCAGNLVVLKTPPGHAQIVAVELDRRPPHGVAGTVAGDDTIFVACISERIAEMFRERARPAGQVASTQQDRAGIHPGEEPDEELSGSDLNGTDEAQPEQFGGGS